MRVLFVVTAYPTPAFPGYGAYIEDEVNELRRRGVEVDVLFINGKESTWNYLWAFPRLWWRLLTTRYDLIHAHYVLAGLVARLQPLLPVVMSYHGAGEMWGWVGRLCQLLAPTFDAVTVTSPEHYRQVGFAPAVTLPCGVDMHLFRPMDQGECRARLGLPADKKLVLFVAELRPEKRLDIAQAAVERLKAAGEPVELVIVTARPHEEIPVWMNACDVFVMTSEVEGSPVTLKEAMACNLPVVSVAVADVPALIGGVEGCFLCDRDPVDVAAKLKQSLDRGARSQGREAISRLSVANMVDRLLAVYDQAREKQRG